MMGSKEYKGIKTKSGSYVFSYNIDGKPTKGGILDNGIGIDILLDSVRKNHPDYTAEVTELTNEGFCIKLTEKPIKYEYKQIKELEIGDYVMFGPHNFKVTQIFDEINYGPFRRPYNELRFDNGDYDILPSNLSVIVRITDGN